MSQLYRLVYYSRNAMPGPHPEIVRGTHQILETSRRNNAACDVTGALMFNSGCFAQILEAPRAGIESTFERIQRDPRHSAVVVLEYGLTERRAFSNWSMAFVGGNEKAQADFGSMAGTSGFDMKHVTAEQIFTTLHRLVREEELAA
jgi:hypothetical protein